METPRHQVTRVRRETRRRSITISSVERLSRSLLRVHFTSPDLSDFDSASPDDHIKLFVPDEAGGTAMRDYTPRRFDPGRGTLCIDFALHEAGPATRWALAAKEGDQLQIGGPRGSAVLQDDFDWYLLVGDETAIPSIGRRLEEIRPEVSVTVICLTDGPEDHIIFADRPGATVLWLDRSGGNVSDADLVKSLFRSKELPAGEGYVWIAAEAAVARALRPFFIEELDHPRHWIKASGYWTQGSAGTHVNIKDDAS